MAQVLIAGNRRIVRDFVSGSRIVTDPPRRKENDDEILREALIMSNHGQKEEADEYINAYLTRKQMMHH